jgi:hypothetical protein
MSIDIYMATFYPRAHQATNERFTENTANSNNISAFELFISNERVKQYFEDFNKNGNSQVLLGAPGGTAVLADSTILPIADPDKREGWLFENNLYFFGGTQEILTLGNVASLWVKMYIDAKPDNSVMPFLQIYTKPTGVGDAGAFYHSRITYKFVEGTVGIGEEMVFYAINIPSRGFSNRKLQLANKIVLGDGLDAEEVLYMVVASDTTATTGGVRHCINQLGFNTVSLPVITRSLNLITEEPSAQGDATAANQILQLDQETITATNTTSIDDKISKGEQGTIAGGGGGLQQVLLYGRDQTTDLHPIRITPQGDIDVEIAEYPKGQELSADSFPVVIASDQSVIPVEDTATTSIDSKITVGEDDTLTSAMQILIYGRKDSSPTGLSAVKVAGDGSLHVSTARNGFSKSTEVLALPSNGTAVSTSVNTLAQDGFGICASSTNSTDPIELFASNDDLTYFPTNVTGGAGTFYHEIYHPAFNYYRISQTDTTTTAGTINVICSKR